MSYILDALKKSDQERQRGNLPGVHSLQTPPAPGRKSWPKWPILLMVALLLNAGLLAWWWLSPMSRETARVAESQTARKPPAEATMGTSPVQEGKPFPRAANPVTPAGERLSGEAQDSKARGTSPQRSPGVARVPPSEASTETRPGPGRGEDPRRPSARPSPSGGTGEPSSRVQRPASQPPASKEPVEVSAEKILAEMENAATGAIGRVVDMPTEASPGPGQLSAAGPASAPLGEAPVAPPPTPARDRDRKVAPDVGQIPTKPSKGGNVTQETAKASPPAAGKSEGKVPDLRELTPTLQREVPSMSFSMLVYSEVPGERMISINGRVRREGDEVSSGLKLEEIVPGGAIFSFKGQRFRKGVF